MVRAVRDIMAYRVICYKPVLHNKGCGRYCLRDIMAYRAICYKPVLHNKGCGRYCLRDIIYE